MCGPSDGKPGAKCAPLSVGQANVRVSRTDGATAIVEAGTLIGGGTTLIVEAGTLIDDGATVAVGAGTLIGGTTVIVEAGT